MAAVARIYQAQFDARPGVTLAATNGGLSTIADLVAQTAQRVFTSPRDQVPHSEEFNPPRPQRYDWYRTARFAIFGVSMGPLIGRWNGVLEKNFPLRAAITKNTTAPATSTGQVSFKALGKRVIADQTFMAPLGLVIFVGSMGAMEGRTLAGVKQKYLDMFKPALIANWEVWPAIQLINFRFMPLAYRVPFQASCGVFWTLYLSLLNAREDIEQDGQLEAKKQTT